MGFCFCFCFFNLPPEHNEACEGFSVAVFACCAVEKPCSLWDRREPVQVHRCETEAWDADEPLQGHTALPDAWALSHHVCVQCDLGQVSLLSVQGTVAVPLSE